jgi:hypothetical protein
MVFTDSDWDQMLSARDALQMYYCLFASLGNLKSNSSERRGTNPVSGISETT